MNFFQSLKQKFVGSRLFNAIIWGANYTDYSRWDKRKMVDQGYERNPVFAAIVDSVAELVSSLPVYVEYKGANHRLTQSDNHPILEAMERSDGGRKLMIDTLAKFIQVTGEGYLQKLTMGEDELLAFVVMPSQYTNPIQGTPAVPVIGYEYNQNGRERFDVSEVVYIRKPSLSQYFHGTSPTTALAEVLDLQNSSITWNKNVAQRGGLPSLLVKMPGITPDEAADWKIKWSSVNGGAGNAGLPMIDGGRDTEYQNINFKPNEAEWSRAIEISTRLIAMRSRFPSELLNDPSGKTYANVTEATKTLYRDLVLPLGNLIYGQISRDCKRYYKDAPTIKINEDKIVALQDDKTKLMQALTQAAGQPILSVNDARAVLEYTPSDDPQHNQIFNKPNPKQNEIPNQ
jgi:HK97 family phage portal protein